MINTLYEQFRHWSDGGGVWLMGDPHFNDKDCSLMDPDWPYAIKQINILNKYIGKNDTFICLGDVGDVSYVKPHTTEVACFLVPALRPVAL